MIVDLFSGPRGWDVGLWLLGGAALAEQSLGLEYETNACDTARAAGFRTWQVDVSTVAPASVCAPGMLEGLIASPPCKAFSKAGKREGIEFAPALARAILDEDWAARPSDDPLVWLALEVGRWVQTLRPRWVACEQVPEVMPLWRAYREVLERWGYSAWCGTVTAEQYGVPQTRERAILLASLDRRVGPPPPTHERYEGRKHSRQQVETLGFLKPWVSMAEALGWGLTARPSTTLVASNRPNGGGPDPLSGGSGSRKVHADAKDAGDWKIGFPRLDDRGDSPDGYRERDWRHGAEPSFALTEKARSWTVATGMNTMAHSRDVNEMEPHERSIDAPAPTLRGASGGAWTIGPEGHRQPPHAWKLRGSNDRPNATARGEDEPAPTIAFGHAGPEWVPEEGTMLNTGRDWQPTGGRDAAQTLPLDGPAPAVTSLSGGQWQFSRPATTVAGHKENSHDPPGKYQQRRGEQAQKLTPSQALVLQSFPATYPVQGNKTRQFEQIGNAIPPLLAAHVLAVVTGRTPPQ